MKILFLSLDRELLGEADNSEVVKRQLFYVSRVDRLMYIIYSPEKYQFKEKVWHEKLIIKPSGGGNPLSAFYWIYQIGRNILTADNYNLIVAQDPFFTGFIGWLLKKRFKVPLQVDVHGDFFKNPNFTRLKIYNIILLLLGRLVIKKADGLRAVSEVIKQKLIGLGIKSEKINVVPVAVNLEHFQKVDQEQLNKLRVEYKNKLVVLFVGFLKAEKSLDFFLKVFKAASKEQPQLNFLIIGDGPEKSHLHKLVENLHLENQVKFLGQFTLERLPAYYFLADIFILPSKSESFGRVILEAAMARKAILASKTAGALELLVDNQTGLLFNINDFKDCYFNLNKLITQPKLRESLGQAAFQALSTRFNYYLCLESLWQTWFKIANYEPR